jgi:DNA polymerase III epsilon subunit-like protein
MYIAWDTETTGLPSVRTSPTFKNLHNYDSCRIVSLAAVKFSSRGRELASFHRIIKPEGYEVSATEVHGITHEYAMEHGSPFREVFKEFMNFVGSVDTLVAHNSRFDENVMLSETLRLSLPFPPEGVEFDCTNQMHKQKMFSPIKLIQLYTNLFGRGFDGAHDALNDARACGEVYPLLKQFEYVRRPLHIPRVVIKASDVSSIMGMSQFKKPNDIVEELWRKYSPDTCTMKTKDERALELLHTHGGVTDTMTTYEKGLVSRRQEMPRSSPSDGSSFYTYNVCYIEGTLYQIMGRVARIRQNGDGSRTVIEMKQRTKGLFNRVRDYEEVQCRVYLAMMHPSVQDALLVESYKGDMKSYLIQRDCEKWGKIKERIEQFCAYFHHCVAA